MIGTPEAEAQTPMRPWRSAPFGMKLGVWRPRRARNLIGAVSL